MIDCLSSCRREYGVAGAGSWSRRGSSGNLAQSGGSLPLPPSDNAAAPSRYQTAEASAPVHLWPSWVSTPCTAFCSIHLFRSDMDCSLLCMPCAPLAAPSRLECMTNVACKSILFAFAAYVGWFGTVVSYNCVAGCAASYVERS